jgi:hypothetical protein
VGVRTGRLQSSDTEDRNHGIVGGQEMSEGDIESYYI